MGQSNVVWSFAARGRGGDGGEVAIVVNIEDGLAVFEAGVFRMVMVGLDAVIYMVGEADLVEVETDGVFTGAVKGVYGIVAELRMYMVINKHGFPLVKTGPCCICCPRCHVL